MDHLLSGDTQSKDCESTKSSTDFRIGTKIDSMRFCHSVLLKNPPLKETDFCFFVRLDKISRQGLALCCILTILTILINLFLTRYATTCQTRGNTRQYRQLIHGPRAGARPLRAGFYQPIHANHANA